MPGAMEADSIDKGAVVRKVREAIAAEMDVLRKSAASAREAATHEQAKPENDKDTRALEASYLAGAQAGRLRALQAADKRLEFLDIREKNAAEPGALVALTVGGKLARYFLADAAGGTKVEVEGNEIVVLTPESPLGSMIIGRRAGESFERTVRGEPVEYEIRSVR